MMFRGAFTVILPLLILGVPVLANAADVSSFELQKTYHPNQANAYLLGVGEGFSWANAVIRSHGGHPLYCVPGNLALNFGNYSGIVDRELTALKKNNPSADSGSQQIELVLYMGLVKTFPCPK